MQCHATTGMSTATYLKSIEAGIDNVDTAISSMSMTYGHSPTESLVAILEGTERDTGLDIILLEEIAAYFREVRKKYAKFEGSLKGVDSRILVAQVPGGMLTNLEGQLKEQNASDRLDDVLLEIPKVRKELGYIPLVTPTSQIVGTQAVLNVLTGNRYQSITKETEGVLKGEYGATPAPVDTALQEKVLAGGAAITGRPADDLQPEFEKLKKELLSIADDKPLVFGENLDDDVLTYALFPQPGLKFLENRNNPSAFEPMPQAQEAVTPSSAVVPSSNNNGAEVYTVDVQGQQYVVKVTPGGDIQSAIPVANSALAVPTQNSGPIGSVSQVGVTAPLAGNIFKVMVKPGDHVQSGDVVVVLEAMKMETEIRAASAGQVQEVLVQEGDSVSPGATLVTLG
jgi:oxaloacetate decarboxylase alpha subunit